MIDSIPDLRSPNGATLHGRVVMGTYGHTVFAHPRGAHAHRIYDLDTLRPLGVVNAGPVDDNGSTGIQTGGRGGIRLRWYAIDLQGVRSEPFNEDQAALDWLLDRRDRPCLDRSAPSTPASATSAGRRSTSTP